MRLALTILLLSLLCADAQYLQHSRKVFRTVVAAPVSCDTIKNQQLVSDTGLSMYQSDRIYFCHSFVATNTFTSCKVEYFYAKTGSPTGTVYLAIHADNAGNIGTALSAESDAVSESSISTGTYVAFTGVTASISNGTKYWIRLRLTSASGASNYTQPKRNSAGDDACYYSANGTAWTLVDSSSEARFKIYGN